ncbi:MAG: PepSY domain-containing protein [Oleispira sp.]|nr:PepSY domain-containing protein [Oleispira sp.]
MSYIDSNESDSNSYSTLLLCAMKNPIRIKLPTFPSFSARVLHNWFSIALVLPLFIVGMSTFFMSHEEALGQYVIGYSSEAAEIRDLLTTTDGRTFLATKEGAYQATENTLIPIEALSSEIRMLEQLNDGRILAAGKYGLWISESEGAWVKRYSGDIHGVQIEAQLWYLITKRQGVVISRDQGLSWQKEPQVDQLLSSLEGKRPLMLGDFMKDLHTGEALLGKKYEWIWADILAFVLVLLSLTGVYMWWKSQKRKQALL